LKVEVKIKISAVIFFSKRHSIVFLIEHKAQIQTNFCVQLQLRCWNLLGNRIFLTNFNNLFFITRFLFFYTPSSPPPSRLFFRKTKKMDGYNLMVEENVEQKTQTLIDIANNDQKSLELLESKIDERRVEKKKKKKMEREKLKKEIESEMKAETEKSRKKLMASFMVIMSSLLTMNIGVLISEVVVHSVDRFSLFVCSSSHDVDGNQCCNIGILLLINTSFISHDIQLLLQFGEISKNKIFVYVDTFLRIVITACIYAIFFDSACLVAHQIDWFWSMHIINIIYNFIFTAIVILNLFFSIRGCYAPP